MSVTPDFIGQIYKDTNTGNLWRANSLTPGDWTLEVQNSGVFWTPTTNNIIPECQIVANDGFTGVTALIYIPSTLMGIAIGSSADLISLSFPNLVSIDAGDLESYDNTITACPELVSFSAPSLTLISGLLNFSNCPSLNSIDLHNLQSLNYGGLSINGFAGASLDLGSLSVIGGGLGVSNCSSLTSLDLLALTSVSGNLNITLCASLVVVDLSGLTQVTGNIGIKNGMTALSTIDISSLTQYNAFDCTNDATLQTINVSGFVPVNGKNFQATGCALTAATVNAVLARHVANAGYVTGSIQLGGGTSAAPTGQGIIDAATLTGRGCTVTTN